MLALSPLGGSVVTLRLFYKTEIGNLGCGLVDMYNRKFSLTVFFSSSNYSMIFSSSFRNDRDKWQLVKYSQEPVREASYIFSLAFCTWP